MPAPHSLGKGGRLFCLFAYLRISGLSNIICIFDTRIQPGICDRHFCYTLSTFAKHVDPSGLEALQQLPEKEQKVVTLYYYEELTLKEIANVLEVSESRVSQLHTRALGKMKNILGAYMNILTD